MLGLVVTALVYAVLPAALCPFKLASNCSGRTLFPTSCWVVKHCPGNSLLFSLLVNENTLVLRSKHHDS